MGWLIIIGTIPIGVLGFLFQDVIRGTFRNLWLVAIVMIVFGLLLGAADRYGKRSRELTDLTYPHGLALGFAQALALIPGVSRSARRRRSASRSATRGPPPPSTRSCSRCPRSSAAACTS